MELQARLELFKGELALILSSEIREFVEECIKCAPDYIFDDCPSSTSGKYHPIEELGPDGTVLHTKKVFALAYELSRALDCENHRDEVCAAALLHDMLKQGEIKAGHTLKEHPQLMAKFVADIYNNGFKGKINRDSALMIYYGIFYHYGPWTSPSVRKPITEFTQEELCVYMSDYVASKRFISVDINGSMGGMR